MLIHVRVCGKYSAIIADTLKKKRYQVLTLFGFGFVLCTNALKQLSNHGMETEQFYTFNHRPSDMKIQKTGGKVIFSLFKLLGHVCRYIKDVFGIIYFEEIF